MNMFGVPKYTVNREPGSPSPDSETEMAAQGLHRRWLERGEVAEDVEAVRIRRRKARHQRR
jgi:hypothetical protein